MRVYSVNLFNAADLSQPSLTSEICDIDSIYGFAIQVFFTGNAVGSLSFQGSCDSIVNPYTGTCDHWSEVNSEGLNAPGSILYNVDAAHYKWVRIVYTKTSGTGNITANLHAKGV